MSVFSGKLVVFSVRKDFAFLSLLFFVTVQLKWGIPFLHSWLHKRTDIANHIIQYVFSVTSALIYKNVLLTEGEFYLLGWRDNYSHLKTDALCCSFQHSAWTVLAYHKVWPICSGTCLLGFADCLSFDINCCFEPFLLSSWQLTPRVLFLIKGLSFG